MDVFAILGPIELVIFGVALIQIALSLKKLAADEFKDMAVWLLLLVAFMLIPYMLYIANDYGLLNIGSAVMYAAILPSALCTLAAAWVFSKFVATHSFGRKKR